MRGSAHETSAWRQLAEIEAAQFGVFHRHQAIACGLSEDALYRASREGRFERDLPRIYRDPSVPTSWEQRLMAALLWAGQGAAISHRSAAALWRFPGFEGAVELTAPLARRAPPGLVLHRGHLSGADVTTTRGFRASSPTRTLIDLAAVVDDEELEVGLDSALHRRLTSVVYLSRRLDSSGPCHGGRVLREMLAARMSSQRGLESPLETKFFRLVRRSKLPLPTPGHSVGRFRLDFAYPHASLGIELEGHEYHSGKTAWLKDVARRNHMTDHGWTILYFTWDDVTRTPADVVAAIRRHLFPTLVS